MPTQVGCDFLGYYYKKLEEMLLRLLQPNAVGGGVSYLNDLQLEEQPCHRSPTAPVYRTLFNPSDHEREMGQ